MSATLRYEQMQRQVQAHVDAHGAGVAEILKQMEIAREEQSHLPPSEGPGQVSIDEQIRALEDAIGVSETAMKSLAEKWENLERERELISALLELSATLRHEAQGDEDLMRGVVQKIAEGGHPTGAVLYEGLVGIDPWWAETVAGAAHVHGEAPEPV